MAKGPQRWICWPGPDKVCVQGGCGYCNPFHCACGKRHTGSRRVTLPQVARLVYQLDLYPGDASPWPDIDDGMVRQAVLPVHRKHLTDYADHTHEFD